MPAEYSTKDQTPYLNLTSDEDGELGDKVQQVRAELESLKQKQEEIEREKRHLIGLQQLEQVSCRFSKQMHQVEVSLAQRKSSSFSSNRFWLESDCCHDLTQDVAHISIT